MRPRAGAGRALLRALLLCALVAPTAHGQERRASDSRTAVPATLVRELGAIPDAVREASGLAVSRAYPGTFWTHNDSGGGAVLYALDSTAALVARVRVEGVSAVDWEGLDLGPCPDEGVGWCLYIADTGDNARRRRSVSVHVVPEPDPRARATTASPQRSLALSYANGAFDVEGLAVSPSGEVVLATKGRAGRIWLYAVSGAEVRRRDRVESPLVLQPLAALPLEPDMSAGRWLTGAAFHPDGTVLALRSYTEVYFYGWPPDPRPEEVAPVCALGLMEPIGEAIAFSADARLYLASEALRGRPGRLLEIECAGLGGRGHPE